MFYPIEDRMARGGGRGGRGSPLARLQRAVVTGRVKGLSETKAREILGDDDAAREAIRLTREREPMLAHMQEMDAKVRQWERERKAARAGRTAPAGTAKGSPSRVTRASRTPVAARRAVGRRRSGGGYYIDRDLVVRDTLGMPLPVQPPLAERQRMRRHALAGA